MTDLLVPSPISVARRILIVEDEPLIAYSLMEVIAPWGFECVGPIADLAIALQLAASETLDAAILNLIIQGGTAYGVAAVLGSRNIPFAFASGVPHHGLESDWQDKPYIAKPYSYADVREILELLMPHHNWPPEGAILPEPPPLIDPVTA